ncbi:MAG: 5-formyltetrahydrofolate cyclo-ligase [Betaproteobacteria bacterium]|nr:5-formyltetrahydrofolate cyclo-ligase [Betaproteobacteria bacterium]
MNNLPESGKTALRQQVLAARDRLGADARRQAVSRILPQLVALPAYRGARTVAAYMGFGSEIDTGPFIETVLSDAKVLVLPRVDAARRALSLHQVAARDRLVAGPWGIREPAADWPEARMDEIDFILVPGVAFDRRGQRIGYGAGYYDRLLAGRQPHTDCVAIAFDCQVVARVPTEPHDQRIDRLITETLNDEFFS